MTKAHAMPRILVVGYATATWHVLKAMYEAGAPPVALFTLAESKLRRFSDRADFRPFVTGHGLKVIPIPHVNDSETIALIRKLEADALFVMGWSQIVSPEVLALFPRGAFGLHPSYLPSNKGRAPIAWTILKCATRSAVSFFRLANAVDSGTVHVQVVFDVDPRETATTLYAKVNGGIAAAIPLLLEQIESGTFLEVHSGQPESYNFARRPQDGFVDWSKGAEEIDRLVRASTRPYPGAFTAYKRRSESPWEKLVLWSSDIAAPGGRLASFRAMPGQVLGRTDAGDILINAGKGVLIATELEAAGQPAVSAKDFRIAEGARLGFQIADFAPGSWQGD